MMTHDKTSSDNNNTMISKTTILRHHQFWDKLMPWFSSRTWRLFATGSRTCLTPPRIAARTYGGSWVTRQRGVYTYTMHTLYNYIWYAYVHKCAYTVYRYVRMICKYIYANALQQYIILYIHVIWMIFIYIYILHIFSHICIIYYSKL